ncbi:phage tail sheath C-terminal domain-containing protein [Clostridium sp.]|uniref:phage tail sheath C-terminal domain-containing protein n=1 Tax=Clostridium sp. TaxID=1506 RepID=UPI0030173FF3
MGLPEVIIEFQSKGTSAIQRSGRGVVALILKDSTKVDFHTKIYKGIEEVSKEDFTAKNHDYIAKVFMGVPAKVIIERIAADAADYNEALQRLKIKRFNYLAIPGINEADTINVATWFKGCRNTDKKTFKAVLPNCAGNDEGIINFTTEDNYDGTTKYSASEYTARIAGVLAGIPLTRSATYYVLEELESIKESINPNADIDEGKLILINDGDKIKIGRGVNSLTTTSATKGEDFKKIKIVEGMDLVRDDIRDTFQNQYAGKVINNYDNKILFLAALNAYFRDFEKSDVLDPNTDNRAEINIIAQKEYLTVKGVDVLALNDQQIKEYNTGSKVFLSAFAKFVDAMEDLYFEINI